MTTTVVILSRGSSSASSTARQCHPGLGELRHRFNRDSLIVYITEWDVTDLIAEIAAVDYDAWVATQRVRDFAGGGQVGEEVGDRCGE